MRATLSPAEFRGWEQHFAIDPPGNWHTHYLLAYLIATVQGVFGDAPNLREIAPWLFPPERDKGGLSLDDQRMADMMIGHILED